MLKEMAMKQLLLLILAITLIAVPVSARWGQQEGGWQGGGQQGTSITAGDEEHLVFMREEEKLARDVYTTFSIMYPRARAFGQIDNSEQKHTDAVKRLLDKYGIEDPSTDDNIGAFTGDNYGEYFTERFEQFIERGSNNVLDAMYVGAFIEELDMIDIRQCNQAILDANPDVTECGLDTTKQTDIQRTMTNLLNGSKNHLRAYVRQIERRIGYGNYEAQLLTQEEVDEILGR